MIIALKTDNMLVATKILRNVGVYIKLGPSVAELKTVPDPFAWEDHFC